jgi:uncharacterized protein
MELIKQENSFYLIRLAYGEELREEIEKFCAENGIKSAWFNAIGAAKDIEIATYNLEKKEYDTKQFAEMFEVVGVMGNISIKDDDKPFMHAHGSFSRPSLEMIGGHIMRCVISATCEIALVKQDGQIQRKHDGFTGLHLLCQAEE